MRSYPQRIALTAEFMAFGFLVWLFASQAGLV
jgi:hypothetical protein